MGSTEEELDNLGLNLKKVQEKFMEWTGESFKKTRLEQKENHDNMLLNGKGDLCLFTTKPRLLISQN